VSRTECGQGSELDTDNLGLQGSNRSRDGVVPVTPTTMTQAMVHTVKVTLTGVRPAVWRRVEVPSAITLGQLSEILGIAFGWGERCVHEFEVRGVRYVASDERAMSADAWPLGRGSRDEDVVRLSSVAASVGEQFDCVCTDAAGEKWRHRVVVEKVGAAVADRWYPVCASGAGFAPEARSGRPSRRFDDTARARLNDELCRVGSAAPGRDLPSPGACDSEVDTVFEGLFPALAEDGGRECPCGCGSRSERGRARPLPVHYPTSVDLLADLATESALVRRAVALAHWTGRDRQLTTSGVLRLADARRAVEALGLAERVLPLPGLDVLGLTGRAERVDLTGTGRGVHSAREVPALQPLWAAAVAAGLIEVSGMKALPGPGLSVWDGPAEPEQRVESWARLLAAYLRSRSEEARRAGGYPVGPAGDVLSASVPLFYVKGAREPVTVGMIALALAGADTDGGEPPPLWLIPSLVSAASEAAQDWVIAGVLTVVPPPAVSVAPLHGVLGVVGAQGQVSSVAGGAPRVPAARGEVDGCVGQFRGTLVDLRRTLTSAAGEVDGDPFDDHDPLAEGTQASVDSVISALAAGPLLMVSPLGAHGLARLLRAHGWWVPESGDCTFLAPDELLDHLLPYVPEDAVVEAGVWIAAQQEGWASAVREVAVSAAVTGPEGPGRRAALPAVLCAAGPRVAPLLDLWRDDPWLSAVAAAAGESLGVGPGLTLGQRLWLAVDATSAAMGSHEAIRELVAASELLDLLRAPGGVAAAVSLDHPRTFDVLSNVVPHLDDRDVTRSLRRALAGRGGWRRGIRPGQPLLRLIKGMSGQQPRPEGR
jgi:hypothetical protein